MTPVRAGVHTRENRSVTARAEKRLLIWIASRLPAGVTSDHLSAIGLAAMVVAAIGFAAMARWPGATIVVILGLVANWFGDASTAPSHGSAGNNGRAMATTSTTSSTSSAPPHC